MKILSILEKLFVKILISVIFYICTYTTITIAEGDTVAKVRLLQPEDKIYSVVDGTDTSKILYQFKIQVDENATRNFKAWEFQSSIVIHITIIPQLDKIVPKDKIHFSTIETKEDVIITPLDISTNDIFDMPNNKFKINIKNKLIEECSWKQSGIILENIEIEIEPIIEFEVTPKQLNLGTIRYDGNSYRIENGPFCLNFKYKVLNEYNAYILIHSENNFNLKNKNGDTIKYSIGQHEIDRKTNPIKMRLLREYNQSMFPKIQLVNETKRKPVGTYKDTLTVQLLTEY